MKHYEAVYNEDSLGVYAISLVGSPATGELAIAFSEDEDNQIKFSEIDKEQRVLLGLVLAPNQPILRSNNGELFTVQFNEETIKNLAYGFQKNSNQKNSSIEHDGKKIEGLTFVETWTVENPKIDKSVNFGLEYPKGSWLAMMKIDNDDIWNNYVKTGKVKGFSIDAMVRFKEINTNTNQNNVQMSKIDKFAETIKVAFNAVFSDEKVVEEVKEEVVEVKTETTEEVVEEVKAESTEKVEEVKEEVVEMSEDEFVKFSAIISEQVKAQVDAVKVEFSKQIETISEELKTAKEDLKKANEEIVKFSELPVGKKIISQPRQVEFKEYDKMTNYEKLQYNKQHKNI